MEEMAGAGMQRKEYPSANDIPEVAMGDAKDANAGDIGADPIMGALKTLQQFVLSKESSQDPAAAEMKQHFVGFMKSMLKVASPGAAGAAPGAAGAPAPEAGAPPEAPEEPMAPEMAPEGGDMIEGEGEIMPEGAMSPEGELMPADGGDAEVEILKKQRMKKKNSGQVPANQYQPMI